MLTGPKTMVTYIIIVYMIEGVGCTQKLFSSHLKNKLCNNILGVSNDWRKERHCNNWIKRVGFTKRHALSLPPPPLWIVICMHALCFRRSFLWVCFLWLKMKKEICQSYTTINSLISIHSATASVNWKFIYIYI